MATTGRGSVVEQNLFDFGDISAPSESQIQQFKDNTAGIKLQIPANNNAPEIKKPTGARTLFINEREAVNNMLNAGISEQEAFNAITEKRKKMIKQLSQQEAKALRNMAADDVDINEAISFVKERRYKNLPLWKKAAKVPFDLSVGATSLVAEQTGNLLDFVSGGQGDFKESVEGIKEVTDRSFADSSAFQAGRNIMGTGELIAAAPTKLAPTLIGRVGQGAAVGGAVGGVEPILEKGSDVTMGEIGTGAALGGTIGAAVGPVFEKGVPFIAKTISKAKNLKPTGSVAEGITEKVTRDLPEAVVRKDLGFTPTERRKVEEILGMSEGRYVLQKGLGGQGKEEMAEFFARNADTQYNDITTKLANTTDSIESESAKQALEDIIEQLSSSKKIANAYKDDIIAAENMLAKGKYTGSELNNIRRAYDKVNTGMYTVAGKAKAGVENEIDIAVRKELNNQIEEIAEKAGFSVKDMNKELRASLLMKDSLLRRFSQEQKNNFLGLQDLGVSAILSGGNPIQAMGIIGAKKLAEDAAPGLSQKLYNLNTKKDVVSKTVKRGNTINTGNKSSRLGLSNSTGNNVPTKAKQGEGAIKKSENIETAKQLELKAKKEEKVLSDLKKKLETKNSFYNKSGTAKVKPLAKEIITDMGLDATQSKTALTIIREYIKKFGAEIKNKLGDLVDEIADKVGARIKLIDDSGKDFSTARTAESAKDIGKFGKEVSDELMGKLREKLKDMDREFMLKDYDLSPADFYKKVGLKKEDTVHNILGTKKSKLREGQSPISKNGSDTGLVARERFDIPSLEKLGTGSDRVVYDLGDGKVLKVSKTARGLEQTAQGSDYLLQDAGVLPQVFESGRNYTVTEKVKMFKDMTNPEKAIIRQFEKDMANLAPQGRGYPDMGKISEGLEKYGWEDLANYDMQTFGWRDIRKANLGIKNGQPVLIDEGTINLTQTIDSYAGVKNLDDVEFREIYQDSKTAKKLFGDLDKNTMYSIGGMLIGGDVLLEGFGTFFGENQEA